MLTSDFDYPLPPELIASHPVARGRSRLLVVPADGDNRHLRFSELPSLLRRGDLLVLNNTRVIAARLYAVKEETGAKIEVLLVPPLAMGILFGVGRLCTCYVCRSHGRIRSANALGTRGRRSDFAPSLRPVATS